jgi:hypothetical protein
MAKKDKGKGALKSYESRINNGIPKRLALNEAMGSPKQEKTTKKQPK